MLATSDPDTSQISGCILKYVLERCRHIPQNWDLLGWWGIQQRCVQQLPYLAVGLLQQTALLVLGKPQALQILGTRRSGFCSVF